MANATSEGETAPSKKAGAAPTSAKAPVKGEGTRASPWTLQTPSLSSEFVAFRDEQLASTLHQCFCYGLPTACLLMVLFPNPIALERSRASRCSPRASSKTRLPRTRSEIAATLSAPTGHPSSSRIGATDRVHALHDPPLHKREAVASRLSDHCSQCRATMSWVAR